MRSEIFIVPLMLLFTGFLGPIITDAQVCSENSTCPFEKLMYYSIDGACNNLVWTHMSLGKSDTPYGRVLTAEAPGGRHQPPYKSYYGYDLPSPRALSRALFPCEDIESNLTHLAAHFGIFLMHDMFSTKKNGIEHQCCESCFGIPIEENSDPLKSCGSCMNYSSLELSQNFDCKGPKTEGINENTHYIDASQIFGSTTNRFENIIDSNSALKMNKDSNGLYESGDDRINENPLIMAVYNIFAREYNRILNKMITMQVIEPQATARNILVTLLQHITFNEFLPLLLGSDTPVSSDNINNALYNQSYANEIYNSFTIAFKLSLYSMVRENYTGSANTIVDLKDHWKDSSEIDTDEKLKNIVNGLLNDASYSLNSHISGIFTNDCSHSPDLPADIVAYAIQDSRYLWIPPYAVWLYADSGTMPTTIASFPHHDQEEITKLGSVFKNMYDVDFVSGALTEKPVSGARVGKTLKKLFEDQFSLIQKADRLYYENEQRYKTEQLATMKNQTMAHLLCRNILLVQVKKEAFNLDSVDINCSELKDIDFCQWKDVESVEWTEWRDNGCMFGFSIAYRYCLSNDKAACVCSGEPVRLDTCPGSLIVMSPDFYKIFAQLIYEYQMAGTYNGIESIKKAIILASG